MSIHNIEFNDLLFESFERIKAIKDEKPAIFVIGNTGSGKSTFINAKVLDLPLKENDCGFYKTLDLKDVPKKKKKIAEIAHSETESGTIFPTLYEKDGIVFVDTGGLNDSRDTKYSAVSTISTQYMLQASKLNGIICIVAENEITAARGKAFKDLLSAIQKKIHFSNFKSNDKVKIKFAISKSNVAPTEVKASLQRMLENDNENQKVDISDALKLMIEKPVITYNTPEQINNIEAGFLDFGEADQDKSIFKHSLASKETISFLYNGSPWQQVLDAGLKLNNSSENVAMFSLVAQEVIDGVNTLLPQISKSLTVKNSAIDVACFGQWPFKLKDQIKSAEFWRTVGRGRKKVAKAQKNTKGAPQEEEIEQTWSEKVTESFQSLFDFDEFDVTVFRRKINAFVKLLQGKGKPTATLSKLSEELKRDRHALTSSDEEGIYDDHDMKNKEFFDFKCDICELFNGELDDEITKGVEQVELSDKNKVIWMQERRNILCTAKGMRTRVNHNVDKIDECLARWEKFTKDNLNKRFYKQVDKVVMLLGSIEELIEQAYDMNGCSKCGSCSNCCANTACAWIRFGCWKKICCCCACYPSIRIKK